MEPNQVESLKRKSRLASMAGWQRASEPSSRSQRGKWGGRISKVVPNLRSPDDGHLTEPGRVRCDLEDKSPHERLTRGRRGSSAWDERRRQNNDRSTDSNSPSLSGEPITEEAQSLFFSSLDDASAEFQSAPRLNGAEGCATRNLRQAVSDVPERPASLAN